MADDVLRTRRGRRVFLCGTGEFKEETGEAQRFNYVRIWKRLPGGGWKVVLDVINSIPPANKPAS